MRKNLFCCLHQDMLVLKQPSLTFPSQCSIWICNTCILYNLINIPPTVNEMEAKQRTGIAQKSKFGTPENVSFVQQFKFVGGKHKKEKRERKTCFYVQSSTSRYHLYSHVPPNTTSSQVQLTFSLLDGGGLGGGAWVCVAFGAQQTAVLTSGTGLRVLSANVPSFLGLASAAVSTVRTSRDNRSEFEGVDVPSVDLKVFSRTHYITAVNQRWSGGGNIWPLKKKCVHVSPPIEKEPSSLLCMMRLSTCRVMGEGSGSEGLSRGPSSWRKRRVMLELSGIIHIQTCLFMSLNIPFKPKLKSGHSSKCLAGWWKLLHSVAVSYGVYYWNKIGKTRTNILQVNSSSATITSG